MELKMREFCENFEKGLKFNNALYHLLKFEEGKITELQDEEIIDIKLTRKFFESLTQRTGYFEKAFPKFKDSIISEEKEIKRFIENEFELIPEPKFNLDLLIKTLETIIKKEKPNKNELGLTIDLLLALDKEFQNKNFNLIEEDQLHDLSR